MEIEINVPQDHVVNAHVSVVQTMDSNGRIGYIVSSSGDLILSTGVGLLELAKNVLIEDFNREKGSDL